MAPALATIAAEQPQRRRHLDRNGHDETALTARWSAKPKPAAPAPIVPPSLEIKGRVLATFASYDGLQAAMRSRVDELRLTRLELDYLSGNQPGYSSKLMCQPPMKRFGRQSLGDTLGAVGCFLALMESPEQIAKLKAVADALSALSAAVALGVTREEFEQIAGAVPKTNMGSLGDALVSAGCKMALVEDPEATKGIVARAKKRQRPLRPATLCLTDSARAQFTRPRKNRPIPEVCELPE